MRKKKEKKRKKKNFYEDILSSFKKLNDSIELMASVSKSLRSTAKILKGPVQDNIANSTKNIKSTAKIINDIKDSQLKMGKSKVSIFDANDLNII